MNIKHQKVVCNNCGYSTQLTPSTIKETKILDISDSNLYALYIECPVCGERTLKQLDNDKTNELRLVVVKLKLMQRKGKKLSDKQKKRLFKFDFELNNIRKSLNTLYWDEVYQLLNK